MRHKHGDYYDFENSEETVDDFLNNVRSQPKPSGLKRIKCSFLIENIQQSAFENLRPILNKRYWTTDVYRASYFNDFFVLWAETKCFEQGNCKWYVWQLLKVS